MLRELDAKLLLAVRLATQYGHYVLIGYDKYFTKAIHSLGPVVLLEKSMSTIMLQGRILDTKKNGGYVVISDEEGINDLLETPLSFSTRVDNRAWKFIDLYACWGKLDYEFYLEKTEAPVSKLTIVGNVRSDLLNQLGKTFYHDVTRSIKTIFGSFLLVSDNFAVDHVLPGYQPPRFHTTDHDWKNRMREWDWQVKTSSERRENLANIIQDLLHIPRFRSDILIRPHPVFNPLYWSQRFSCEKRISILLKQSADPWILASDGVLSSGCTLGLQSIVSGNKSIHVDLPTHEKSRSITSQLSCLAASGQDVCEAMHTSFRPRDVDKFWLVNGSSTERIARILDMGSSAIGARRDKIKIPYLKDVVPIMPKWTNISLAEIQDKVNRWSACISMPSPNVQIISPGVYIISPSATFKKA